MLRTAILFIGGVTIVIAVSLVASTTALHRANERLGRSIAVVHLAEEAAMDLLAHERAHDNTHRAAIEVDLRRKLDALEGHLAVASADRQLLADVREHVASYQRSVQGGDVLEATKSLESAYGGLDALVAEGLESSRVAQRSSDALDTTANVVGISSTVLLLIAMVTTWWWLEHRAFTPTREIAMVMLRFAGGERGARAPEVGTAELRDIARSFNEMATSLAAHREAQIASLAGVAHDLRNPLSTLKLGLATLKESAEQSDRVALLRRQVHRIDRMVNDLLDTARIDAGQFELELATHDLRRVVRGTVESARLGASESHHLELELPDEPVLVRCDASRIEQVLENMVGNAVKYSPAGGTIVVTLAGEPDVVRLAVTDPGIGVAEHERRALFTPFRRAGSAAGIPGIGLGLHVCRRIIEAHGGTIEVESRLGEGSTFTVTLPR